MKDESDEKGCLILALGAFILSAINPFFALLFGDNPYNSVTYTSDGEPINSVRFMKFTFFLLIIALLYYLYKKK